MKRTIFFFVLLGGLLSSLAASAQAQHDTPRCPVVPGVVITPDPDPFLDGQDLPITPPDDNPDVNPPDDPNEDFRAIYWLHGLGGGASSWVNAKTATDQGISLGNGQFDGSYPARKTYGYTPTYMETNMQVAIDGFLSAINNIPSLEELPDRSRNFVIAHSQGGVVSRAADMDLNLNPYNDYERMFFGIVTFGTPHQGAPIINSRDNGRITELAQEACTSILYHKAQGLLSEKAPGIFSFFVDPNSVYNTVESLCGTAAGQLPFLLSSLGAGTTTSYSVGAAPNGYSIDEINAYGNPDIYKAGFYGAEFDDADLNTARPKQLLWRTISSMITSAPTFQADDDNLLVNEAAGIMAEFESAIEEQEDIMQAIEDDFGLCLNNLSYNQLCILNPPACLVCTVKRNEYETASQIVNNYEKSIEFMNRVNEDWMAIIGSKTHQLQYEYWCSCDGPGLMNQFQGPFYGSTPSCAPGCTPNVSSFIPEIYVSYEESDGVLPRSSQEGFPGVTNNQRMEKTNHMQMRNSSTTKEALNNLFNGVAGQPWFATPKQ